MSEPTDFNSILKQAKRCLRAGDDEQAIVLLEQAVNIDADRADVHDALAAAYYRKRRYEKAIEHFTAVARLNPTQARTEINIGAIHNRLGQYDQAVHSLRRGIQKDRKCSEGYYNIGLAYRGLNQLSMAVSAYREAIRLNPEMAEAHQNLANVYVEMGNHQQAILHYKKALEIRPGFERAERGLIAAQKAKEQAERAISPFGRLVSEEQLHAAAAAATRELSDEERMEDRHEVHQLSVAATGDTSQWLDCLRNEVEPALKGLARALAEGEEAPIFLANALPTFRTAVTNCRDQRTTQKRKLDELRSHEQYISDPGSGPPR